MSWPCSTRSWTSPSTARLTGRTTSKPSARWSRNTERSIVSRTTSGARSGNPISIRGSRTCWRMSYRSSRIRRCSEKSSTTRSRSRRRRRRPSRSSSDWMLTRPSKSEIRPTRRFDRIRRRSKNDQEKHSHILWECSISAHRSAHGIEKPTTSVGFIV